MCSFLVCEKEPAFPLTDQMLIPLHRYTICDDGRRQAGTYFSAQARNKRTTQRTHKRDGQNVTNFMFAKAGGRKRMYVLIRNRNPDMADMAMADMTRVIHLTTNFVPTAGWSVRPCLSFFCRLSPTPR